jgi:hypothetical protein
MLAEALSAPLCPNHPDAAGPLHACSRCAREYCGDCVVLLGGQTICAACKEEQLRDLRTGVVAEAPLLYAVGLRKFALLSFCSMGLFPIYWSYRSWKALRDAGSDVSPILRAFFSGFTNFSLFKEVERHGRQHDLELGAPGALLAILTLIISQMYRLPGPWWAVSLFAFVPMLPVVSVAARVNALERPNAPRNESIRGADWLVVAAPLLLLAGGAIWAIADTPPR